MLSEIRHENLFEKKNYSVESELPITDLKQAGLELLDLLLD